MKISEKVIERLTRYRALLAEHFPKSKTHVFSHEIAAVMRMTPSQVRRDLMCVGYFGVPRYGYEIAKLIKYIGEVLDGSKPHNVAVVGVGNIGRALIAFLEGRRPLLKIVAAFDSDPSKTNRIYNGIQCHHLDDLEDVLKTQNIRIAILCVPAPEAQRVTDRLVWSGVKGILNFAPVPLRIPAGVALEEIDVTSALEKVAFYTTHRASAPKKEKRHASR